MASEMPVLPEVGSMIVSPGLIAPRALGVLDQRQGGAVLDRAGRVVALELGQDPDVRVGRDARAARRAACCRSSRRGPATTAAGGGAGRRGSSRRRPRPWPGGSGACRRRDTSVSSHAQQPHVLVVEVDVDEPVQLALAASGAGPARRGARS